MTHRTLSSIIFSMIFSVASYSVMAAGHASKNETEAICKEVKTTALSDHSREAAKAPVFPAPHPKVPHGKAHVPHMEELPHIHKFHKERVKKIKKHHGKYWLLSQILLALCHLSILVIGYLHATH
jgi:hypothetical protein